MFQHVDIEIKVVEGEAWTSLISFNTTIELLEVVFRHATEMHHMLSGTGYVPTRITVDAENTGDEYAMSEDEVMAYLVNNW